MNAVSRCGPASLSAIEKADHARRAMGASHRSSRRRCSGLVANSPKDEAFAEHGEEAAVALARHKAVAEPLIERFGRTEQRLDQLEPQQRGGSPCSSKTAISTKSAVPRRFSACSSRFGDKGMTFVYRN